MKSPLSVLLKIITYDFIIIAQPPCNVKVFSKENKNVKKQSRITRLEFLVL